MGWSQSLQRRPGAGQAREPRAPCFDVTFWEPCFGALKSPLELLQRRPTVGAVGKRRSEGWQPLISFCDLPRTLVAHRFERDLCFPGVVVGRREGNNTKLPEL